VSRRAPRQAHQDSGAALLLAIGFVLMVSVISAGLAALATSGLNNRNTLEQLRNSQYAADGAIEQAISQVRSLTCSPTTGFLVDSSFSSGPIRVDWLNVCGSVSASDGNPYPQRNVVFSACPNLGAACDPTKVIIRAQVNFEPASGTVTKTYIQSWSVKR
jgi:hypothetical protein